MNELTKEEWLERCKIEILRLAPDFDDVIATDLAAIIFENEEESEMPPDSPEDAALCELDAWGGINHERTDQGRRSNTFLREAAKE